MNNTFTLFGLTVPEHPELTTPDVSLFKEQLLKQIRYLLEKDQPSLWNGLYRIDISETKVREIFTGTPDSIEVAEKLSELIIERLIQKMYFRKKYSQRSNKPFEGFSDGSDIPATE
ncbi:MAG: hypothetical protein H7259_00140 [Cytophagales bacterium]|nr:hypothetical protein [Cytophaga sp.]